MTKDLKDLIDNVYQLAINSRDISKVSRMVATIHAVDEALLTLIRERDEARREICEYQPRYYGTNSVTNEAHDAAERRGWDCFNEKETP